jgi:hypothetical protein
MSGSRLYTPSWMWSRHRALKATWLAEDVNSGEIVEILKIHSHGAGQIYKNTYEVRIIGAPEGSIQILGIGRLRPLSPLEALGKH